MTKIFTQSTAQAVSSQQGRITESLNAGLAFLAERELPSGRFRSRYHDDSSGRTDENSAAVAARIGHCLKVISEPAAREIVERICGFIESVMHPSGFCSGEYAGEYAPFCLGDTALCYSLLRDMYRNPPNNRLLTLLNRDERGLFKTWIVFRPQFLSNLTTFPVAWAQLKGLFKEKAFFTVSELDPKEVSPIVNAWVVYMLSRCPEIKPVVAYLTELIEYDRFEPPEKWDPARFELFYGISKAIRQGADPFEEAKYQIIHKLHYSGSSSGVVGANILDTAQTVCAYINIKHDSPIVEGGIRSILEAQQTSGAWEECPCYGSGVSKGARISSPELTTAYCLEALARYRSMLITSAS